MEDRKYTTPYTWDIFAIHAYEARQKLIDDKFTQLISDFDQEIILELPEEDK
jgi:hypothetical protein